MAKVFRMRAQVLSLVIAAIAAPAEAQTYRMEAVEGDLTDRHTLIVQTNSAGTNVHLIDPATQELRAVLEGIGVPHGATLHADGTYFYVTNEHDATVDVIDTRSHERVDQISIHDVVDQQIPLAARPNNISASDRARKVYAAVIAAPLVQVIDMDTNEIVKNIPTAGGVHNTFVTPDGRYAVAGMIGARTMSVIDTETDEIVWSIEFDGGVRPITFDTWPDGSTRRAFVQITGWHGFYVVDWEKREVVEKISPPQQPPSDYVTDGIQAAPSHGSVVLPDQSAIWISSRATASIYGWTLPDLKYIGRVPIGNPAWLTATPDSRYVYVGVASHNQTAIVDVESMEVVKRIPVGQAPKRIYTAVFPEGWRPGVAVGSGADDR